MANTVQITLVGVDLLSRAMNSSAKAAAKLQRGLEGLSKVGKMAGIAGAAGGISALGAAAAPAVVAIAALPAAMMAVKVASMTAKVGIKGVGEAMSAVAEGDAKKMDAALKKLAPSARAFVKEAGALQKAFKPIQQAVQQRMFEGLAGGLKAAGGNILPTVKKGMVEVAGALNGIAKEVLRVMATPMFKGQLEEVFKGTATILKSLKGFIEPLITAFMKLSMAGVPLIKRFIEFAKVGTGKASAFMTSADGATRLAGAMQKAGDVLAQFYRIVKNVGIGIFNIFKNGDAGAEGLLTTIEELTAKFAAWSKSTEGQERSAELFKTLNDLFKAIAQTLVIVGGSLAVVYATFQKLPGPVKGVVIQVLAFSVVLAPLLAKLMGVFKVLGLMGTGLAKVATLFRAGANGVSPFAAAMTRLKLAIQSAVTWLKAKIVALRAAIASAWASTKAFLANAAAHLRVAAATALSTARTIAATVAQKAIMLATKAWAAAVWLVNIAMRANPIVLIISLLIALGAGVVLMYKRFDWFKKIVDTVWLGIRTSIKWAWERVIKPTFEALKQFITGVLVPIFKWLVKNTKDAWSVIGKAIKDTWNNVIKPIWVGIRWYINNVLVPVFKAFVSAIRSNWNTIGNAIRGVWNNFIKPAFNAMRTGVDAVQTAFRVGVNGIKNLWEKLRGILKAPVSFFVNTVYTGGVKRVWDGVRKLVPALPGLPSVSFASGGVVPGGYKPGQDTVLAMMSPGEGVLRPEATRAIGAQRLNQINAAAKAGGAARVTRLLGLYPDGGDANGLGVRGIRGYADGGIIGGIKDKLKKPIDWAKNAGNAILKNGVDKFASGIIDPIIRAIPQGNGLWGQAMSGVPKMALEGFKKFIKDVVSPSLGGGASGPGIANALNWARGQAGKPYVWGGVGPGGYDCSGFMSAITNVIKGKNPYSRLYTTHAFTGATGPAGFQRGMNSGFKVGITHGGVGHMAGTLGNVPVESSGSAGVRVGGGARGYNNSLFSTWYGLKADTGALMLQPGWNPPTFNGTGKPELLTTPNPGMGGNTYQISVNVAPGANEAEVGRKLVAVIQAYERRSGKTWRQG